MPCLGTHQTLARCPGFLLLPLLPHSLLHACISLARLLSLTCWFPVQHTLFPYLFPRPATPPIFRAIKTPVLVSYWFAQWSCESPVVSFCPIVSQWELRCILPFPSYFIYNPKFLASQLRGLLPAFMLVSCSAYLAQKMEVICSSETSVDFQRTTRRYIPEDILFALPHSFNAKGLSDVLEVSCVHLYSHLRGELCKEKSLCSRQRGSVIRYLKNQML
jgi:hypothetical protein